MKTTIFGIIVAFLLISCSVQEPIIGKPVDFRINSLSQNGLNLTLVLPIDNPNNIAFKLKRAKLHVFVNNNDVGEVGRLEKVRIAAKSRHNYNITFDVKPKNLAGNIITIGYELQKSRANVSIKGSITLSAMGIPYKVNVDENRKF